VSPLCLLPSDTLLVLVSVAQRGHWRVGACFVEYYLGLLGFFSRKMALNRLSRNAGGSRKQLWCLPFLLAAIMMIPYGKFMFMTSYSYWGWWSIQNSMDNEQTSIGGQRPKAETVASLADTVLVKQRHARIYSKQTPQQVNCLHYIRTLDTRT